jgi:uncharacterized protein
MKLSESEGEALVRLARSAVSRYLDRGETIKPADSMPASFKRKARVFVTILTVHPIGSEPVQELRGCIGYLDAKQSLAKAAINAAINAATSDPRFPPMVNRELETVVFEVNILDEPSQLKQPNRPDYPKSIIIGKDGLIVINAESRGVLLPEVPVEWNWTPEEFLSQCCLKAGLYPDAWLDPETKVYRFQSDIYREVEPKGRVVRVRLKPTVHSE